jgi:hypothetical protein
MDGIAIPPRIRTRQFAARVDHIVAVNLWEIFLRVVCQAIPRIAGRQTQRGVVAE